MKTAEVKLSYKRNPTGIIIQSSNDAHQVLRDYWDIDSIDYFESFVVLLLSRKNEVLGILKISEGGISSCIVDIRKIYQGALLSNSTSIIIAHNHPSGNLKPSQADIRLTQQIQKAGEFLHIKLFDSIILTSSGYYSMADDGSL